MKKLDESEKVEPVVSSLTPQQQARLNALNARDAKTLTSAETRELEDLNFDSKLSPTPTVGYKIEGSETVYVATGTAGKTKVKVYTGFLSNIQSVTSEDFGKKFEIV